MSQLLVRKIEADILSALKERAARNGRSAEAEHREILRKALLPKRSKKSLKDMLLAIPDVGDDEDFARSVDHGREVDL